MGGIPTLVSLAIHDVDQAVRKKAILALSSSIRNYQPAMNEALKSFPTDHYFPEQVDATDMKSIDKIISKLREDSASKANV